MEILIASDHAGFEVKKIVLEWLTNIEKIEFGFSNTLYEKTIHNIDKQFNDFTTKDLGCHSADSVDYPDYANRLSAELLTNPKNVGILICGTGIGMSMAANKFLHIRAALCCDADTAVMTRKHNNANVLCIGARNNDKQKIISIIEAFLTTSFEEGRHLRRIEKFSR